VKRPGLPACPLLAFSAATAIATLGATARAAEPTGGQAPVSTPVDLPPPSARTKHLLAGAATTAVWYGGALGASYIWPDAPGASDLRIPVAGPWMALGETGCAEDDPDCSVVVVVLRAVLTAIDGVGQAGGLLILGEGLFLPTRSERSAERTQAPDLALAPRVIPAGRDGIGLGLSGVF
jgi:hypothetical protein